MQTLRTKHPRRKKTADVVIWKLKLDMFSVAVFHAPNHTQCLTKKRVPAVIHLQRFEIGGIMLLAPPDWVRTGGRVTALSLRA